LDDWNGKGTEVTATIEYDLWQNVADPRGIPLGSPRKRQVALNLVYKF
jgi:hypothetical protein